MLLNDVLEDCEINVLWLRIHNDKQDELPKAKPTVRGGYSAAKPRWHRHQFYEMHFVMRGEESYQLEDGSVLNVTPGNMVLFPCDVMHASVGASQDRCKIAFAFSVADRDMRQSSPLRLALPEEAMLYPASREMFNLFLDVMNEVSQRNAFYLDSVRILVHRLIICCARLNERSHAENPTQEERAVDGRIEEIMQYIQDHLADGITTRDVAENIHLSTRQINRLLQKEFMMNCHELIDRKKVEEAKRLLAFTDMRMEDIAIAVGYVNFFSFSKFFKRVEGMSPGLFRKSRYK